MQVGMQVGMQLEQEGGFTQHTLGRAERGPQWAVALGSSAERAAPCMAWYPHSEDCILKCFASQKILADLSDGRRRSQHYS